MLEIRLLGEFALLRDGEELPAPTLTKARILVAQLALHAGHEFLRDDLARHLWPDSEIEKARFNLRQLLARIRRSAPDLSPHIVAENRTTIRFDGSNVEVDALAFKRLVGAAPERAIRHYHGSLLEGIEDTWFEGARGEFEQLLIRTLERLAECADAREAVSFLRRAIEVDPYQETTHQQLLLRLAECGDTTGLQIAHRRFKEALHRDLNLAPSPETERLFQHLLTERAGSAVTVTDVTELRSRLPVPATEVLGRSREIRDACKQLAARRLITLLGPGGVGKTRLAVAIGEAEYGRRSDGVWFADFSSVSDPDRVPQTLAWALGLRESPGKTWIEALVELIGASNRLLIFDNCEHLAEATSMLCEQLLSECRGLRILATSRVPLGTPGEQRMMVPPLELPPDGMPESDYGAYSALQLFEARARLVTSDFRITSKNADRVIAICKEVDGLPLGIEMACARLSALSLDEVGRRLDDKLSFLRGPNRTITARHKSLGAVISWSYDLLASDAKRLLPRLAAFQESWGVGAAEAVCGFGELTGTRVLNALVSLVEASLVRREQERYRFPETVRQFARERLLEERDGVLAHARHVDFFLELAEEAEPHLRGPEQRQWWDRLDAENDNLRAALEHSLTDGRAAAALRICGALWRFWETRGLLSEGRELCRRALSAEGGDNSGSVRARALIGAGSLARNQGDFAASHTYQAEALAIFRSVDDFAGITVALMGLGVVAMQQGDYEAGWKYYEEALRICRETRDRLGLAGVLNNLGIASMHRGDHAASRTYHEESLKLNREIGDRQAISRSLSSLGNVALFAEEYGSARDYHEESLVIRRELGGPSLIASSLCNLGLVATNQDDYASAEAFHVESLMLRIQIGDRRGVAESLEGLASVRLRLGGPDVAATLWGAAGQQRKDLGFPLPPHEQRIREREMAEALGALGEPMLTKHSATGRALTREKAIDLALGKTGDSG